MARLRFRKRVHHPRRDRAQSRVLPSRDRAGNRHWPQSFGEPSRCRTNGRGNLRCECRPCPCKQRSREPCPEPREKRGQDASGHGWPHGVLERLVFGKPPHRLVGRGWGVGGELRTKRLSVGVVLRGNACGSRSAHVAAPNPVGVLVVVALHRPTQSRVGQSLHGGRDVCRSRGGANRLVAAPETRVQDGLRHLANVPIEGRWLRLGYRSLSGSDPGRVPEPTDGLVGQRSRDVVDARGRLGRLVRDGVPDALDCQLLLAIRLRDRFLLLSVEKPGEGEDIGICHLAFQYNGFGALVLASPARRQRVSAVTDVNGRVHALPIAPELDMDVRACHHASLA